MLSSPSPFSFSSRLLPDDNISNDQEVAATEAQEVAVLFAIDQKSLSSVRIHDLTRAPSNDRIRNHSLHHHHYKNNHGNRHHKIGRHQSSPFEP